MGPLIDQELEKIDRRHAQLTRLGGELVEALNMYHNLMRDPGLVPPPVSLPYNMKMGMGLAHLPPGAVSSLPNFHSAGGPVGPGGGMPPQQAYNSMAAPYSPYDINGLNYHSQQQPQGHAPPHSAPPMTNYNSMPHYAPPQINGVNSPSHSGPPPQQQQQQPPTQSIPNHSQQAPLQQNVPPMTSVPGQVPYSQSMIMGGGHQHPMVHHHQQQPPPPNHSAALPNHQQQPMASMPPMQMPPS